MKLNIWKKNDLEIRIYVNNILSGPYKATKIWFEQKKGSVYPEINTNGRYDIIASNENELKEIILKKLSLDKNCTFKDIIELAVLDQ